jgi:uncharacterized Zn finger protein
MENTKFVVKASGDSGRDYDVNVEVKDSVLYILCGCPAGLSSTRCKHAMAIANGDFSRIKDESDRAKLSDFFHSLKLHPADGDLMKELELIEMQEKELKDKKKAVKKGLDRLFFQGIPIG